ncbi:hypothetical protein GOV07_04845 [Candidatus Woesearchaeota archaeon]|nr:hypothetical protein [Candidatus Woesearchaeota archaeon]
MSTLELYQQIVSALKERYLPKVGNWKEHGEEQILGSRLKYFDTILSNVFLGVTVRENKNSSPQVRVAIVPSPTIFPSGLLRKIVERHDVYAEPCFEQERGFGQTFNRVCYTINDAERPILAVKDYLQFVMQDRYGEIVERYDTRVAGLENELQKIETMVVKELEELLKNE